MALLRVLSQAAAPYEAEEITRPRASFWIGAGLDQEIAGPVTVRADLRAGTCRKSNILFLGDVVGTWGPVYGALDLALVVDFE